jgi:hypothetical protein
MAECVKNLTGAEIMASLWRSVEDLSENHATMQTEGLLAATKSGPGVTDSWKMGLTSATLTAPTHEHANLFRIL